MTNDEKALLLHEQWNGKLETKVKSRIRSREDLSIAYTPGVAQPCIKIAEHKEDVYKYTSKSNTIAVITDGSAVLGLGNIGPEAAMPVMEGKAAIFKEFADVNAVPICLATQNTDEIISTIANIAPGFGGINLEDISAPRCFEIEKRLNDLLDIPVFHDDQHGTAIVVLAAIINALKVAGKSKENCRVVISGAGAAGIAIAKIFARYGFEDILVCGTKGIINSRLHCLNIAQMELLSITNKYDVSGTLSDALNGADIYIGVSAPGIVTKEMASKMNDRSIIFAMANPIPEIMPDEAKEAGAFIIGTGRSDYPNQVNNVLAFPGVFKGALEGHAKEITDEMKLAAANAIAALIPENELNENNILPEAFDPRVTEVVSNAVKELI